MKEKSLGKITSAEFGQCRDYPFLFGLQLSFEFDGYGVSDGGKYTVNIAKDCKWDNERQRADKFVEKLEYVNQILTDAKVNYVSKLVGKPVEIYLEDNTFKDFRILKEVI